MSVLYLKNNQGIWEEVSTINGHTPVITASKSNGITTIYADGTTVATINDGEKGEKGEDGETPLSAFPNDTASGQIVHITDGADDIPMESVKVNIEPVQEKVQKSTVYDNPMSLVNDTSGYIDLPETFATASYYISGLTDRLYSVIYFYDASHNYIGRTGGAARTSFLLQTSTIVGSLTGIEPSTCKSVRVTQYQNPNVPGVIDEVDNLKTQIEKGSTATSYSPYSNVCPISGWTGANVVRTGVNVWDEEWEVGGYNINTGEKTVNNSFIRCKNPISVVSGQAYHVVCSSNVYAIGKDKDGNCLGLLKSTNNVSSLANKDILIPPSVVAVCWYSDNYGTTYNHDISINYPATDTDYHPYAGDTYSITFPSEAGTVYGGTLDFTNGTLTVDRAMVDLGTLNWSYITDFTYPAFRVYGSNAPTGIKENSAMTCTAYKFVGNFASWNAITQGGNCVIGGVTSAKGCVIRDDAYTDAASFKASVAGQTLAYELATPTTYNLTPTEIKSLYGENNIYANCGSTSVTYRADTTSYIGKIITATKSGTVTTVYVKDKPIATINDGANGKDYTLTTQDKADIAQQVINILPTAQGVSF